MKKVNERSHGITEENALGLREYFRGYSLVDITTTGVIAQYKKTPAFMDNAGQVINSRESWERSRNQQRNWETLVQLVSMITQPTVLQKPKLYKLYNLSQLHFGFEGNENIWVFTLGAEQSGVFDSGIPGGRLKEICHKIPIISGLKETVEFSNQYYDTIDEINLYFEKISF